MDNSYRSEAPNFGIVCGTHRKCVVNTQALEGPQRSLWIHCQGKEGSGAGCCQDSAASRLWQVFAWVPLSSLCAVRCTFHLVQTIWHDKSGWIYVFVFLLLIQFLNISCHTIVNMATRKATQLELWGVGMHAIISFLTRAWHCTEFVLLRLDVVCCGAFISYSLIIWLSGMHWCTPQHQDLEVFISLCCWQFQQLL